VNLSAIYYTHMVICHIIFPKQKVRVSGKWDNFCRSSPHPNSLKPKSFEPWWGQLCYVCTNECILEHLCIWACTVKLDQEQSKHAGLAQHKCKICSGWWNAQKHCALAEKSAGNMIWLLLSVSDWPIVLIAPGGLLLVVPHLFAVPVSVLWWGCKKGNN